MKKLWFGKVLIILLLLTLPLCAEASISERGEYKSREVLSVYVGDINGDNLKEVVALTKSGIVVMNGSAGILWKFALDQPRAIYVDDINKDGKLETIVSAGQILNNIERGSLYILDENGKPLYNFEYMTGASYPKYIYYSLVTADLGGDGYKEVVGGGINGIYTLKDTYDRVSWSYRTNETMIGISLVNSNRGEASMNILANSYKQLYTFSLNGSLINNASVAGGISKVYRADLRNNTGEEVFVLTDGGMMYLFDESLHLLARSAQVDNPLEAGFFDLDGNGGRSMVIGSKNGVYLLDDKLMISKRFLTNDSVHGLYFLDWDNDDEKEILCSSGNYIYSLDKDAQLKERYDIGHRIRDLQVSDLDSNGMIDAVILEDDGIYFLENNESGMGKRARAYYVSALASVEFRRYTEAQKSIDAARKIYADIGDAVGIKQCDELEKSILEDILNEKISNAEQLFLKANQSFAQGDYNSALQYLNQSKAIYLELNDSESAAKCDILSSRIIEGKKDNPFNEKINVDLSAPKDVNILPVLSVLLIIIISILILGLMKKK